jgi:putative membrane protein
MQQARHHVPQLTGALTAVSFAIVLVVIAGAVPSTLFPRAPPTVMAAIPHAIAGVSALAVGTILAGLRAIRAGDVERHRALMVVSFVLFGLFLTVDFYRLAVVGPTAFAGPAVVETYLYRPLLAGHAVVALLTFPAVYYALLAGLTNPVAALPATDHARVGRAAAVLWLLTFGSGLVIYAMLHHLW